jgi:hypothetical protein
MNKLLLLLLLLVIIKLFQFKEGMCPGKCSNCDSININSILNNKNGDNDCGKDCLSCTNIPISNYLKKFVDKFFGTERIYTESTDRANGYGYIDTRDTAYTNDNDTTNTNTVSTSTTTGTTSGSNSTIGTNIGSIFTTDHIDNLWNDVSNGDIQPSIYNCTKDISDSWVPYENGESLCVLDVNGIWRYYEDISGSDTCEPVKCIADFGTEIGQLTCCGQNSTLKSTKYVCPMNLPTCNNFKCGSEFGTCSK